MCVYTQTTLVALLQRLYDPDEGQVLVDGADLREMDAQWYRAQIGVVSQEPRLFSMSVADNIAYGCPFPASREEVEEAARQANAYNFCAGLPQGFDTTVTDRCVFYMRTCVCFVCLIGDTHYDDTHTHTHVHTARHATAAVCTQIIVSRTALLSHASS